MWYKWVVWSWRMNDPWQNISICSQGYKQGWRCLALEISMPARVFQDNYAASQWLLRCVIDVRYKWGVILGWWGWLQHRRKQKLAMVRKSLAELLHRNQVRRRQTLSTTTMKARSPGDAGMIIPNESTEVTVSRIIRHLSADCGGYACVIYTIHPLGLRQLNEMEVRIRWNWTCNGELTRHAIPDTQAINLWTQVKITYPDKNVLGSRSYAQDDSSTANWRWKLWKLPILEEFLCRC